ncbi:MAG: alpha/beta fold hydrolase, partial [Acidimicrobiales bacterium]
QISYRSWGGPADRPVVLHHGFVADAQFNWVVPGVVDALIDGGHHVVALDARGHGRSEKPHDPARYGEETMALDLVGLFDEIEADEVDLVGYSMGSIVSLIAASREDRIRRLVVGGVGSAVVELGGVDQETISAPTLVAALEAEDPATITDTAAAGFRAFADGIGADRLALAAHARVVHAAPIALDAIRAPTLVFAGVDDRLARRPEVLADAIPHAELLLVKGDHFGALNPSAITAMVEFLA